MNKTEKKYHYQAIASKTIAKVKRGDREQTGIKHYRNEETMAILSFLNNSDSNRVMVCGGMGSAGKTATADQIRLKNKSIAYIDGTRSMFDGDLSDSKLFQTLLNHLRKQGANHQHLFIDETIWWTTDKIREQMKRLIEKLLDHFDKIVMFGGGASFTADEQNEEIAKLIPGSIGVQENPFYIKPLNITQTSQFIRSKFLSIYKIPFSKEIAEIIASSYIEYFRILRIVGLTCDMFPLLYQEYHYVDEEDRGVNWDALSTMGMRNLVKHNGYFVSAYDAFDEQEDAFLQATTALQKNPEWHHFEATLNKQEEQKEARFQQKMSYRTRRKKVHKEADELRMIHMGNKCLNETNLLREDLRQQHNYATESLEKILEENFPDLDPVKKEALTLELLAIQEAELEEALELLRQRQEDEIILREQFAQKRQNFEMELSKLI